MRELEHNELLVISAGVTNTQYANIFRNIGIDACYIMALIPSVLFLGSVATLVTTRANEVKVVSVKGLVFSNFAVMTAGYLCGKYFSNNK